MEVYDRAHELARALARSNEYKDYRLCRAKLESDSSNMEMLKDFRQKQIAVQLALISGKEPKEADKKAYEESYRIISLN
ncbi:MAG: YlbF family regulator, partial [Clostridia bacterium]|nr:YlbF family regulator [Clostridia bacterium]